MVGTYGPYCVLTWGTCRGCGRACVVQPDQQIPCCSAACGPRAVANSRLEDRRCAYDACKATFRVTTRSRQLYCRDECAAAAWVARRQSPNSVGRRHYFTKSVEARLRSMRKDRVRNEGQHRKPSRIGLAKPPSRTTVPVVVAPAEPRPHFPHIVNTHVPGTIAFALLYGGPGAQLGRRPMDEAQSTFSKLTRAT